MKSIIKIYSCVLLLTFVSDGVGDLTILEISDNLEKMAKDGGDINGVFKPAKDGYLCDSMHSVCYKGTLLKKDNMEVTMKFTPDTEGSLMEFKIFQELGAFGNETIEVYGIPSVHYYGTWGDCAMMAMTLFDPEFHQSYRFHKLTETDFLILFREIVRITQFTHDRNVFFDHIHLIQLMFVKKQCFIYEFIDANIYPNGKNEYGQCAARWGWFKFLRMVFEYVSDTSCWSLLGFSDHHRTSNLESFLASLKNATKSKELQKFKGLWRVLVELARCAFVDLSTPITKSFYDEPNRVIFEEIERCERKQGKKVEPSWLSNTQDTVQPSSSGGSETPNREKRKKSSKSSRRRRR